MQRLVNEKDGSELVLIPEGRFLVGGPESYEGGVDPFGVVLRAYYLGVYAVTNAQFARFMKETGYDAPTGSFSEWLAGGCPASWADHPVVGVTGPGAARYCAWAGLRLPTELEWEKGARGTDGRTYPWGNDWNTDLCRNGQNKKDGTTAPVQMHAQGASPWGCVQMAGNVWEWCLKVSDPHYYQHLKEARGNPHEVCEVDDYGLRGGSWYLDDPVPFRCAFRGSELQPVTNFGTDAGFRVAGAYH